MTAFERLALRHGLLDRTGESPDGLPERYLYSAILVCRYAFGRWWDTADLAASDVWVLLNPATGDTERRRRPTLDRCIAWSRAAGHAGAVIVNLFAFRTTDPAHCARAPTPSGLTATTRLPRGLPAARGPSPRGDLTGDCTGARAGSVRSLPPRCGWAPPAAVSPATPCTCPRPTALVPWRPPPT